MNVTEIAFAKHLAITVRDDGRLELPFNDYLQNHLNTIHASAQFGLAETASGAHLLSLFPELAQTVVPLLRDAQVKFKRPATSTLCAYPSTEKATLTKFSKQITSKGRGTIRVDVELRDAEGMVVCVASYQWFVQKIDGNR
ncbi:MAG: DUF4442 domain-containing protein [Gammaproteobacteria bacterium]|nr:DUF4442 domain-containing protein [Gammaproteobacteria bacterium]